MIWCEVWAGTLTPIHYLELNLMTGLWQSRGCASQGVKRHVSKTGRFTVMLWVHPSRSLLSQMTESTTERDWARTIVLRWLPNPVPHSKSLSFGSYYKSKDLRVVNHWAWRRV